jgi:proline dehydrogenase
VGAILDYAAEADVDEAPENDAPPPISDFPQGNDEGRRQRAWQSSRGQRKQTTARIYDYSTEQACDKNAEIFESAIRAVHNVSPEGFAAIKVTALGNPLLLERWSSSIVEIRRLFRRLDIDGDDRMTRDEFEAGWKEVFVDTPASHQYLDDLFSRLDVTRDGSIDLIEWTSSLKAADTHFIAQHCEDYGPFAQASLDEGEVELVDRLLDRAVALVKLAEDLDVRVMFDAEHSYFQPAIHNIVLELQRKFNRGQEARVYNTFQCYLRHSERELSQHIERSEREGWHFACKLVRGAYMVLERDRAKEQGYESPIHDTIESTHDCYNGAMRTVLGRDAVKEGRSKANMLVASHNQGSIELALKLMSDSGISRSTGGVYFGQLLGMADHLTFSLGNNGYLAYKYLPYGPFYEVLPYLVRRAQENSSLLGNVAEERRMIRDELVRRTVPFMS